MSSQDEILDPLNTISKMTVQPGGSMLYNSTMFSAGNKKSKKGKIDASTSQSRKNNTVENIDTPRQIRTQCYASKTV